MTDQADQGAPETVRPSMEIRLTDHSDMEDPGTETTATAEMIDQEDQPLLRLHLLHLPDQHGKDDPDMDLLLSPTAT